MKKARQRGIFAAQHIMATSARESICSLAVSRFFETRAIRKFFVVFQVGSVQYYSSENQFQLGAVVPRGCLKIHKYFWTFKGPHGTTVSFFKLLLKFCKIKHNKSELSFSLRIFFVVLNLISWYIVKLLENKIVVFKIVYI